MLHLKYLKLNLLRPNFLQNFYVTLAHQTVSTAVPLALPCLGDVYQSSTVSFLMLSLGGNASTLISEQPPYNATG